MNVERMFNDEIRDKKRTASGVHHKTGKRGYTGKIYFASDLLKGKEKRLYQGTGKVEKYNMYDVIVPFHEYEKLSEEDQKTYLEKYRERFSNKDIISTWGISHSKFYKIIDSLGVSKDGRKPRVSNVVKDSRSVAISNAKVIKNKLEDHYNNVNESKTKTLGFSLNLHGEYSAEDLIKKIEKIGIILSDEESKFNVSLTIEEVEE